MKTENVSINDGDGLMDQDSLIALGGKNIRIFKYLGYSFTNSEKISLSLHTRLGAAFQKWNELKHVLMDKRIRLQERPKATTVPTGKYDDEDERNHHDLKKIELLCSSTSRGLCDSSVNMLTSNLQITVFRTHVCVYGSVLRGCYCRSCVTRVVSV